MGMRTGRIMSACKHSLISFNLRSSLTRSKLRRLKRLQLSTWLNFAKLKLNLEMLVRALTSMNKLWPRLRHEAVLDLLELCKWIRMVPNSLKNIEPFSNMPNIGFTFDIYNKMSNFKIEYLIAIKIKQATQYVPISH